MFTPHETAMTARERVELVAGLRQDLLDGLGFRVRAGEELGTRPSIKLEVDRGDGTGWTEYIESSCTRGAHAFDGELLRSLSRRGWLVLHYPAAQVDERFARLKAEELLELAMASGMDRAEVWVYLYDRSGEEVRVI